MQVLVTKPADKMKVYVATDFKEPVTLHWALSRKGKEWLVSFLNIDVVLKTIYALCVSIIVHFYLSMAQQFC